jgi:hypothetical protein
MFDRVRTAIFALFVVFNVGVASIILFSVVDSAVHPVTSEDGHWHRPSCSPAPSPHHSSMVHSLEPGLPQARSAAVWPNASHGFGTGYSVFAGSEPGEEIRITACQSEASRVSPLLLVLLLSWGLVLALTLFISCGGALRYVLYR